MMYQRIFWLAAALCLTSIAQADDLYRVTVNNKHDAALLRSMGAEGVVRLSDGFLVLVDSLGVSRLPMTGLNAQLVMSAVEREELGLEIGRGNGAAGQTAASVGADDIRVVRMPQGTLRAGPSKAPVLSLADEHVDIEYLQSRYSAEEMLARLDQATIPLEELISRVSRDSLESYSHMLATFNPRFPGMETENQARDWLAAKLASFGVDSVSVDSLGLLFKDGPLPGFNVVGYKYGSKFPNHYLIVGAHRDAAAVYPFEGLYSPGADDDGSGTVAVLEMARILSNIETDMTIVFALFDAEEEGLFGAKKVARDARARGDSVVCMLNLDMIGDINNTEWARIHHGQQSGFADLFVVLADSLLYLNCVEEGVDVADHLAFYQAGYEIAYLEEYNFSSVYHTVNDDTTHISWEYLTRMTKASLATVYAVNATAWPNPTLAIRFPHGLPTTTSPVKTTSFEVSISPAFGGVLVPGSEQLCYSIDDNPFEEVPLVPVSSERYRATLPIAACGSSIRFYVRADEQSIGTVSDMDTSIAHFALSAGSTETIFADDFETDNG